MTGPEAAAKLRKLADAIEKLDRCPVIKRDTLDEEQQLGAAFMVMFLRDLFTIANKDNFTREDILVLLNTVQNDSEIFTADVVMIMEME